MILICERVKVKMCDEYKYGHNVNNIKLVDHIKFSLLMNIYEIIRSRANYNNLIAKKLLF